MTTPPEAKRRASNRDRVLAYLTEHRAASNIELTEIGGLRFGSRVWELRRQGYLIETMPMAGGKVLYRFDGKRAITQTDLPLAGAQETTETTCL